MIELVLVGAILVLVGAAAAGVVATRRQQTRSGAGPSADAFALGDPWRRLVADAQRSQKRFREVVSTSRPGPTRDRLVDIAGRVDAAVTECWAIGRRGYELDRTASAMQIEITRGELQRLGGSDAERAAALQARIDSHGRLVAASRSAENRLRLVEARLAEATARGVELSVQAELDPAVEVLAGELVAVTDELEAVRLALEETR